MITFRPKPSLLSIIYPLFLILNTLQAQDKNQDVHSVYEFELSDITEQEVTVGSNVITEKERQPVSVTTITSSQLMLSGARTLSEAIMYFVPGYFNVEDQDDLIAGFRGMAADNNSKVMLLINGQNLNTEFFWGPPDAILNSTNMDYIEKIEVIRGPGSVTLGQGALLGVINIITRKSVDLDKELSGRVNAGLGLHEYYKLNGSIHLHQEDLKVYGYLSYDNYFGQRMENEGWVREKDNEGVNRGTVFDMNHRLRRTKNITALWNVAYKNLEFSYLHTRQRRDLYNFYRDREQLEERLTSWNVGYTFDISKDTKLKLNASYAIDNFGLLSLTEDTKMGGTREDRAGLKGVLNANNIIVNNKLAIGFEFRNYQMGKNNYDGNNFIANRVGTIPDGANDELTMGFRDNINVFSLFAEDFFSITQGLDLFFAFRYDNHPFWGNNFSPRAGILLAPEENIRFRFTYQTGFRGAVGLHYTGGYRRDGFLRAENYNKVNDANIPDATNIDDIKPEKMESFELGINYGISDGFNVEFVGFYNSIENVIDVGVIWQNEEVFTMVNIGSDIAGDWNGYWYFKNTPGSFNQIGAETSLTYQSSVINVALSHSLVKVFNATEEQKDLARAGNSMYLANDDDEFHFKAYPENIFKLNLGWRPMDDLLISYTSLYNSDWYSPDGSSANGGLIMNLGLSYNIAENIQFSLIGKNLLNEDNLYPMNNNAGEEDVSPGTPAWEGTTVWSTFRVNF